jgi:hypothetical protein
MKKSQRGAALLLFLVVMVSALAVTIAVAARRSSVRGPTAMAEQRNLAQAAAALQADAFTRRCRNPALPLTTLLPCPDAAGTEGVAATSCPVNARGWLPWKSLGLPPLRDSSGTCLWYERQGTSARVIAAGGARSGQTRSAAGGRTICGGNLAATNYMDVNDAFLSVALNVTQLTARCP